jgi:hypothetical protein
MKRTREPRRTRSPCPPDLSSDHREPAAAVAPMNDAEDHARRAPAEPRIMPATHARQIDYGEPVPIETNHGSLPHMPLAAPVRPVLRGLPGRSLQHEGTDFGSIRASARAASGPCGGDATGTSGGLRVEPAKSNASGPGPFGVDRPPPCRAPRRYRGYARPRPTRARGRAACRARTTHARAGRTRRARSCRRSPGSAPASPRPRRRRSAAVLGEERPADGRTLSASSPLRQTKPGLRSAMALTLGTAFTKGATRRSSRSATSVAQLKCAICRVTGRRRRGRRARRRASRPGIPPIRSGGTVTFLPGVPDDRFGRAQAVLNLAFDGPQIDMSVAHGNRPPRMMARRSRAALRPGSLPQNIASRKSAGAPFRRARAPRSPVEPAAPFRER